VSGQIPGLLVLDGEVPSPAVLEGLRETHSPIVAADGAALKLRAAGILPDTIIGDLDTLGRRADGFEREGVNVIRLDSQEENDLEKALLWMIEQNITSLTIAGAGGGMTDHALNNFSVIARYAPKLRITLRDATSIAYILPDALFLACTPGDRISLIPLPTATLRTTGLRWELHEETLALGVREGASNEAVATEITVEVVSGVVALFHYPAVGL
jgi:thiamine pyrophosphokinase